MDTNEIVTSNRAVPDPSERENLFLLSDLTSTPAQSLSATDRRALSSVASWIQNFIVRPNDELGRSGPICPFTPVALEHDTLWLALEHIEGRNIPDVITQVEGYNRLLLGNEPVTDEFAGYKSIFVVFADLPTSQAKDFFEALLKPIGLRFYKEDGLVIGPFYEGNDGTAIYNANFRPFTSPVPSLLMRRAVVSDWKFFLNNPDWFAVWKQTHAEDGTEALAAELRRLPWNSAGRV